MTRRLEHIADAEDLYRRVREKIPGHTCVKYDDGRVVFSASAFNDPSNQPSVDRAFLRNFNPHLTRLLKEDGVVMLPVAEIRQLGPLPKFDNRNKQIGQFVVDVSPDPLWNNCAHALVVANPPLEGKSAVKKLKEGLARIATEKGWHVEPESDLPPRNPFVAIRDAMYFLCRCLRRNS